uniref:Uncharacterized protein n=1 Tax=Rhizophora mucronata TaxID=61149 RepID=A0A2P2NXF3_RHIMU
MICKCLLKSFIYQIWQPYQSFQMYQLISSIHKFSALCDHTVKLRAK